MSGIVNIRAALETALNGMSPALATAWENVSFSPPAAGTPYQRVNMLFAQPDNREYGSRHQERGYMQVKLLYPIQIGTSTINARAELLRSTFARGNTFSSSGVTVMVSGTPEVTPGTVEDDRFAIAVKIPFISDIG